MFWLARLAGLEPATGCLEATGQEARMVPDRGSCLFADRPSSAGLVVVATGTGYRSRPRAVLSGYGIQPDEVDHAIRMLYCMIHGYAMLHAANAFEWSNDPDESVAWMIRFVDAGLTAVGGKAP
jgi:hypothetical protein